MSGWNSSVEACNVLYFTYTVVHTYEWQWPEEEDDLGWSAWRLRVKHDQTSQDFNHFERDCMYVSVCFEGVCV